MAFVVSRSPLTPSRTLAARLDPACKVVRAHELQALNDAQEMLALAARQADLIVEEARQAYASERQRGYEEGREAARLEQAEQMIENVARNVEFFGRVEGRMVDLVMQAVQRIIADYDDRDRVLLTVRNVLSVVRNQKQLTLRIDPRHTDLVRERMAELLSAYPGVAYLDVVGDPRLKDDACILESEVGLVEASMETQLAALRQAFDKVLGSRA